MCGRYALFKKIEEIDAFLNAIDSGKYRTPDKQGEIEFEPKYNVYPSCVMPVANVNSEDKRILEPMYWGYMGWKPKKGQSPFTVPNTKAESILTKSMWKGVINKRRCIIPVNGFYEWHGPKTNRIPHYIFPTDGDFFGFAGLFSNIAPDDKDADMSFSIITIRSNNLMEKIHDRMPVILHPTEFNDWLNPNHQDTDYLLDFLKPYPDDAMDEYIVSQAVNSPAGEGEGETWFIQKADLFG